MYRNLHSLKRSTNKFSKQEEEKKKEQKKLKENVKMAPHSLYTESLEQNRTRSIHQEHKITKEN